MAESEQAEARRNRVTFDADDDVAEIVSRLPRGMRRRYLNEVVRRHENPPYRLHRADSPEHAAEQLTSFVEAARDEIVLVGLSLELLVTRCHDLIERKVRERVSLTVILLQESIEPGSGLYEDLRARAGGTPYADQIIAQVRRSHAFFREIREIGAQVGTRVTILACGELPMCGFLLLDRNTPSPLLRVNIYSSISVDRRHPFFEIEPTIPGGKDIYDVFYSFYDGLLLRTKSADPSDS